MSQGCLFWFLYFFTVLIIFSLWCIWCTVYCTEYTFISNNFFWGIKTNVVYYGNMVLSLCGCVWRPATGPVWIMPDLLTNIAWFLVIIGPNTPPPLWLIVVCNHGGFPVSCFPPSTQFLITPAVIYTLKAAHFHVMRLYLLRLLISMSWGCTFKGCSFSCHEVVPFKAAHFPVMRLYL